jgi:2-aminoadipate transaminase
MTAGPLTSLRLESESGIPYHRQIRRRVTRMIGDRELAVGDMLPSTRAVARHLGISRLTVLKAFQSLERAGLVGVRAGRGYYVRNRSGSDADRPIDLVGVPANFRVAFEESFSETVRSARDMPLTFAAGYPDVRLLPLRQVRRLFLQVTEADRCTDLLYQAPGGHPHLREHLWRHLEARGIPRADDIDLLVTNGAQHALDIFSRAFARQSGIAAVETPTYYGALAAFRINGFDTLPVLQDAKGLSITALAELCRNRRFDFLYTNPTYNNPTGMTLTAARRTSLARLADQHDFIVLEDDTYADLGFTGAWLPSLFSLARARRVFRVGSFSKSFIPGLRIGYIVGPRDAVKRMADLHGVNDMCSSTLSQVVMAEALASGFYDRHVRRMRRIYRKRLIAMETALREFLPSGCVFHPPRGGIFFWIRLPESVDCAALQRRCNARGVDFAPGPLFSADGRGGNYIRLNFTLRDEDDIRTGIACIAEAIAALSDEVRRRA